MEAEGVSTLLIGQRSRSRIRPFFLHRPSSVAGAVALFERSEESGKASYMAGGIDLIDRFKSGMQPQNVIDLAAIADLSGITEEDGDLVLGASVTHEELAANPAVNRLFPSLAQEWGRIANPRIRAVGTLGGNVMANNSSYDGTAVALAADADLSFAQCSGVVTRKADEPREPSDLLLDIRIRHSNKRRIVVNRGFRPIVAFALSSYEGSSYCEFRLAVNTGFPQPAVGSLVIEAAIPHLSEADAAAITHDLAAALPSPLDDWRASAKYRKHLLKTLVKRELLSRW